KAYVLQSKVTAVIILLFVVFFWVLMCPQISAPS
ncbi:MAG: hypothetical protein JWO89_2333, partial [Verrucomicrobiaceae bacterium]|nr:hypothetical protein [Verrucomicrobiaceae bacterium]